MDEHRKGICTNIGNCKNADSKLPIDVALTADFICPECERELLEIKGPTPIPWKKILLFTFLLLILGLLIFGGIYLFSDKGEPQKSKTDLLNKINSLDQAATHVNKQPISTENTSNPPPPVREIPKAAAHDEKSNPNNLTANSIEEYFQKIADESIPYANKKDLKKAIISKYFSDDEALVIDMGKNNTEVGHTSIKDYVDVLSQQYYKIQILKKEFNSDKKITKLFIKEL